MPPLRNIAVANCRNPNRQNTTAAPVSAARRSKTPPPTRPAAPIQPAGFPVSLPVQPPARLLASPGFPRARLDRCDNPTRTEPSARGRQDSGQGSHRPPPPETGHTGGRAAPGRGRRQPTQATDRRQPRPAHSPPGLRLAQKADRRLRGRGFTAPGAPPWHALRSSSAGAHKPRPAHRLQPRGTIGGRPAATTRGSQGPGQAAAFQPSQASPAGQGMPWQGPGEPPQSLQSLQCPPTHTSPLPSTFRRTPLPISCLGPCSRARARWGKNGHTSSHPQSRASTHARLAVPGLPSFRAGPTPGTPVAVQQKKKETEDPTHSAHLLPLWP